MVDKTMSFPIGSDEEARLAALYELGLLDTPEEPAFDRITRLVTKLLNVPMATVTLVDAQRQWFKSSIGIGAQETSRDVSFCTYTIMSSEPFVVEDASQDARFAQSSLVTSSQGIRFYLGIPLRSLQGFALGALCAFDTKPRVVSADELATLQDLAAIATEEVHLRERLVLEKKNAQVYQQQLDELHRSMESQIERRTNELNLVIESAYDAYISIDANDVVLDWNRAAEVMFGWTRTEALSRTITELIFPAGLPTSNSRVAIASTARRRDGTALPVEIRIKTLMIDGRERRSLFLHDITERQQLERLRDQQAREDVLTKLPNRRALDERLPDAMARTRRTQQPLAVLFLDLDGFKAINDTHGHAMGDEVLRIITQRLVQAVRATDYVARWAGDEFVVLLEGSEPTAIEQLADNLIQVVQEPTTAGKVVLNVSVSIGVALYLPASAETANELLKRADVAMYEAKHAGKAQVRIAQPIDSAIEHQGNIQGRP